jgi:MFS family permease
VSSALTAAAFPWGGDLPCWFVLRWLNGLAAALSLVPLETIVNRNSAEECRARNFGFYAFSIALGMALGTLVAMEMAQTAPRLAFVLCGSAALVGSGIVLAWRPVWPADDPGMQTKSTIYFGRDILAFGSGWAQGFLEGPMVSLLPLYLLSVGLTHDQTGWLMGGVMMGVILAQAPLAWLADRLGRGAVLASCNLAALLGIICLSWTDNLAWLAGCLFVVGACSGALYPLGLALLGERTPLAGMSRAGAWFLAVNCTGSVMGPALAGTAIRLFGQGALFVTGAGALVLVLAVWLISAGYRRCRYRANAEQAPARVAA